MSEIRLEQVSKFYDRAVAVDNVDLTVGDGEFLTLLGPSGCGKTTTLRMVAGFLFPTSGEILLNDQTITRLPPNRRDTGMVFQTYALFPHMTVAQNVRFGLKMRRLGAAEAEARVAEVLRLVQLEKFADRLPRQLSGGQQQRVALARAVVIRPQVLLMDEPLGALDLKLRQELQIQIRDVQRKLGITTIYVTHDQGEALSLSDRVAVMRDGRILQLDAPEMLYRRPVNAFVANFVGRTNVFPVEVLNQNAPFGQVKVRPIDHREHVFSVPVPETGAPPQPGERFILGFRPECCAIHLNAENALAARVTDVRYSGATRSLLLESEIGHPLDLDVNGSAPTPGPGEQIRIGWQAKDSFLLPIVDQP